MEGENKKAGRKIPAWLKTVLPIIISTAILYYYLHDQDWPRLVSDLRNANVPLAILGMAAPQFVFWAFDSWAVYLVMKWFLGGVKFKELFLVKGATFLLSIISAPLQGGGVFVYLMRKANVSVEKLAGMMLFRGGLGSWVFGMYMLIATAAAQWLKLGLESHLNMTIWWALIIGGQVWLVEAWLYWHHGVNVGFTKLIVDKQKEFWSAFVQANRKQWLIVFALSAPTLLATFLGYYAVARSFGIDIQFFKFMTLIPVVVGISFLPVSFGGYGTTTLAWTTFFAGYASETQIAAVSLFVPTARLVARGLIGVGCLPGALKDLGVRDKK